MLKEEVNIVILPNIIELHIKYVWIFSLQRRFLFWNKSHNYKLFNRNGSCRIGNQMYFIRSL